jgi:GPI ethanolamine phosphate transferase 3 subunit O
LGHIIGVDHAGHTYSASHNEIERKLNDTEELIRKVIDKMDNKTTLLVFGDHGMTDDGNHGGASEQELRSVLFSYRKSGFPMKKLIKEEDNISLMRTLKQLDLPSIVSDILGISRPFQNLGVLHPWFFINDDA